MTTSKRRSQMWLVVPLSALIVAGMLLGARPTPAGGSPCSDLVVVIAITPGYQDGEGGNYINDGRGQSCADVARPRAARALAVLVVGVIATGLLFRPSKQRAPEPR